MLLVKKYTSRYLPLSKQVVGPPSQKHHFQELTKKLILDLGYQTWDNFSKKRSFYAGSNWNTSCL